MGDGFEPICCDECGVEITWTPVMIDGRPYCCHDCAVGLQCSCACIDSSGEDETEFFWLGDSDGDLDFASDFDYR
jgi:hypothetical protein